MLSLHQGFPGASVIKNSPTNAGDAGSIPGRGRSPGGGHDNPLQYSCLENPRDRGAWSATDHGVVKSRTRLSIHMLLHTCSGLFWMRLRGKSHRKQQLNVSIAEAESRALEGGFTLWLETRAA